MPREVIARPEIRPVGGFDNGPCYWCQREAPCRCGSAAACVCSCGRCMHPFPLPDDGKHYREMKTDA